jgi:hypothetical protein
MIAKRFIVFEPPCRWPESVILASSRHQFARADSHYRRCHTACAGCPRVDLRLDLVRPLCATTRNQKPRAVDWSVRPPATFTRCDLSLSKTPKGAILPQNHSESGECRLQRIGAQLSRSTRRGCLRCHERRTRLDGAIHRRRPCTAQDSRERVGPGSYEDSHLEARGARQCHGRRIRKSFRLLLSTVPLARWGEPEDLAKAVLFLASDDSSRREATLENEIKCLHRVMVMAHRSSWPSGPFPPTATSVRRVWRRPFWRPHHSSALRVASARDTPMNTLSMAISACMKPTPDRPTRGQPPRFVARGNILTIRLRN